ncbi:hypothetical protein [Micromonospora sp. C81]|uniref:hypothetical protein n=1 Tax=Micromonospora sp. C81 TaxID=2824881 RepID=UPI001B37E975|nr:hypothetical protein [Micromonospora sp. C81]MBQ1039290.1 hypothetical protein [Micromonospora sp. C81]
MPAPANYIVMRNATITIDDVEYANQLTKARLVPDTPIQTMRTLVPDGVIQDVDSTIWTLELAGASIWATGGLAKALTDAEGDTVEVVLQPKVGTGQPTATFNIVAMPVTFGGEQGQIIPFEATFPVVGGVTFGTSS